MINKREVKSQAEIARQEGVNKARITQIMNLLKLAPEIQDYLKNLKEPKSIHFFTENRLRPIAKTKDHHEQTRKFEELKQKAEIKAQKDKKFAVR